MSSIINVIYRYIYVTFYLVKNFQNVAKFIWEFSQIAHKLIVENMVNILYYRKSVRARSDLYKTF